MFLHKQADSLQLANYFLRVALLFYSSLGRD